MEGSLKFVVGSGKVASCIVQARFCDKCDVPFFLYSLFLLSTAPPPDLYCIRM